MDETASFLAEWETKQRDLGKTVDDLHAFYHSTRDSLLTQLESIRTREKQLKERESKSDELDYIEEAIIEKNIELEEGKTRLRSLESRNHMAETRVSELEELIKARVDQLSDVESKLHTAKTCVSDLEELIKTRVDELSDVETKLVERVDTFDLVRESMLKENDLWFEANVGEELKVEAKKVGDMLDEVRRREMVLEQESRAFEVKRKEREIELFSLQKKVEEREVELRTKKFLLDAKELGLKLKQCGCGARSDGLEATPRVNSSAASPSGVNGIKINSSLVKTEEPESLPATRDEMNVPGFPNQNSSGKKFSMSHLVASLFAVKDPAQILLSWVKISLDQYMTNGNFDEGIMLRNILLLMNVSAQIGSHLIADAKMIADANCVAAQWKKKLRNNPGNPLENLGFLLYIATCGLDSILTVDEVLRILELISESKQALEYFFELKKSLELCQASFAEKMAGKCFADKMADIIHDLCERMKLPHAITIRFSCILKLIDSPVLSSLLKQYVDESTKCFNAALRIDADEMEKKKADLEAVIHCLRQYHLESGNRSKIIETHIIGLDVLQRRCWKVFKPCSGSNIEQRELRKRKDPTPSTRPVQHTKLKKK